MTTTATLDGLRAKLEQLEARIDRLYALFNDPGRDGLLERLMRQYIKPCQNDLDARSYYDKARERLSNLEAALESCNITAAVTNGRLQKPNADPGFYPKMLFLLIELSRERDGLKEALEWLTSFESRARSSLSGSEMARCLGMVAIDPCGKCECNTELHGQPWSAPSLEWVHAHHAEYNRAVWEIVNSVPGLMDEIRKALQADIACEETEIIAKGDYATSVIDDFLTPTPSPAWVGGAYDPIAA